MTDIPFARGVYDRRVAKSPSVAMRNRFVESNPVLSSTPVSAIARPKMRKFGEVGTGPGRGIYCAAGVFKTDLFIVSGLELYRVASATLAASLIGQISTVPLGDVSMAATAPIGDGAEATPARLFIADGGVLWVYTENGEAGGHLQATGPIANNDVVKIDTTYYKFTNAGVDVGTPAGTIGSPWLVKFTGVNANDLQFLFDAINNSGTPGTDYSTLLVEHTTVRATVITAADLYVNAKTFGTGGNVISTTETGAGLAWSAATLSGGGAEQLRQIEVPLDAGAISVAHINSFIIVVPEQSEDLSTVGRFYWIEPGDTFIDPLNFATAERSPDGINQVGVFSNMFWLAGQITTEPWITTGDPDAPMQRYQSILYDRGAWQGTMVQVKDSLIIVDEEGSVFRIGGGQTEISEPHIAEAIRRAMQRQGAGL